MQIIPVILKALEFLQNFHVKIMKKKKKFKQLCTVVAKDGCRKRETGKTRLRLSAHA